MAVSKRTRFEVLKRDNYTCRYCRSTEGTLVVDHVLPVALGGTDEPTNLVAACRDCNAGKSSTSPTEELVQAVSDDDIRWAAAVKRAAEAMLVTRDEHVNRHEWFDSEWKSWDANFSYLPGDYEHSLDAWIEAGLPKQVIIDCLDIAVCSRHVAAKAVFAYMGGICRNRIAELHEAARLLLDGGPDGA